MRGAARRCQLAGGPPGRREPMRAACRRAGRAALSVTVCPLPCLPARRLPSRLSGQLLDEAHGVGEQHGLAAGQLHPAGGGVQRGKQLVLGQHPRVSQRVEQRGLACGAGLGWMVVVLCVCGCSVCGGWCVCGWVGVGGQLRGGERGVGDGAARVEQRHAERARLAAALPPGRCVGQQAAARRGWAVPVRMCLTPPLLRGRTPMPSGRRRRQKLARLPALV